MKINKIRIRNFYSIEDSEINLDECKGITLLEGRNLDTGGSNGAGKSSFIEAIVWGITGKTIRKSNEEALVNNKNKRKCMVELYLNDNILIRRQRKPTFLELFVGDENLTKESVNKTQEQIDELLGCNYKSLLCTSFFGQHNNFSFLDATPEDKRNIINNFLNLGYILDNRKAVKDLKSKYYQQAKSLLAVIKEHKKNIETVQVKKKAVVDLSKKYKNKYTDDILSLSLDDILDHEEKERQRKEDVFGLKRELDALDERREELEAERDGRVGVCDKCYQDLPPTEGLDMKIVSVACTIDQVTRQLNAKLKHRKKLPITSREYSEIQEYKDLCRDAERYDDYISDLEFAIETAEKDRSNEELMYNVMKFWEKAFSEQGVIKYVIRNILEYFNDKANYYLSYLCDNQYVINFDEELKEKITCRGVETQYISLSGGEKRRVNLAVLMALKDLFTLNNSFDSNVLFLDEIAENLDEKGIESLYTLLQEIKKTKNIFIITHNKYLKSNLDSVDRISIIKAEGITTIRRN